MLFTSFVFPIFFLTVWALYLSLKHKPQNLLLLVASYVFYGWWDWRFLSLLLVSTCVDFFVARAMGKCDDTQAKRKKVLLFVSLATNLGILCFFKYFNFFADSVQRVLDPLGLQAGFVTLNILLPVGISFYTFQTMAYAIDVYRGKQTACKNFWDFALYVAYFPQLVAGPIERSQNLLPRITNKRSVDTAMIYSACQLILMGYFKKVFIADGVAPFVNDCFADPSKFGGVTLLIGAWMFAIQIYGDFSGYTDIARGVSRLFGIDLMLNFRQPYLATNITDFWRRWHISLSTWLRDYLYIPLGGNRRGKTRTYVNNMLTMLLGGLWHGAAWHFVIWGGLHGAYLAIHKWWLGGRAAPRVGGDDWLRPLKSRSLVGLLHFSALQEVGMRGVQIVCTFNLVCLAWIFFRADSISLAIQYISRIVTNPHGGGDSVTMFIFYGSCVLLIDLLCSMQRSEVPFTAQWHPLLRGTAYAMMLFLIIFIGEDGTQPFIYFQF